MRKLIFVLALLLCFPSVSHAALATSLVSYWKLDESSGNAADSVGSNTLTNNNTVTFSSSFGKINNGASLNGSNQYFSITDASQTGLDIAGDFSICLWHNPQAAPSGQEYELVAKWTGAGTRQYRVRYEDDGAGTKSLAIVTSADGTVGNEFKATQTLNVGTYYFLCFLNSGGTGSIYVNASSISGSGSLNATIANTGAAFNIGARAGGTAGFTNGYIDEVGIWSRALTGTEITTLYNGGNGCQYTFAACEGAAVVESIINLVFSDWIW